MDIILPALKWVGGKSQLITQFAPFFPKKKYDSYCEPFLGGGAVLFHLHPENAFVSDVNPELINFYQILKTDCSALICKLKSYTFSEDFFYSLRNLDRDESSFSKLSNLEKAARTYYLNRTCYNGLYRVNSKGQFNSPFGKYKKFILFEDRLTAISNYLNNCNVNFYCHDFECFLDILPENSFVYLDPPYDPVSDTAYFTSYAKNGFLKDDQVRLKEFCDKLNERGIRFMLSNSATDFICELYSGYKQNFVQAKRSINSKASNRGAVKEIIVRNYK